MILWLALACARPQAPALPISDRRLTVGDEPGLSTELLTGGALEARLSSPDDADLVLIYGGEEQGSLDACGCPNRPRGGLARQQAYADATRAMPGAPPVLQLNGGQWLDDAMGLDGLPRPDASVVNAWMVRGLIEAGFSGLNLGYSDMAGLRSLAPGATTALPMLSANISGPNIEPYRVVQAGPLRVAITGITDPGVRFLSTPGFEVADPIAAGKEAIRAAAAQSDVVVLLAFHAPEAARSLARSSEVDVVIDTNLHRELYPPIRVGGAVWVRSHFQTMRLGELRLHLGEDGVERARDRKIDMDDVMPDDPALAAIATAAGREISQAQRQVFGRGAAP